MDDVSRNAAPSSSVVSSRTLTGTVLSGQANYYWVKLDTVSLEGSHPSKGNGICSDVLLCTRRSRLKKVRQTVRVGDRVRIEEPDWVDGRGAIADVMPRTTELDRPPIANANQILLLFALAEPDLEPIQLSRFLVKAESTGMSVCVGLNKRDLVSPDLQQAWCDRIETWGYSPITFSIAKQTDVEVIYARLQDRITVVSGPSGVGKSSLINALIPAVDLRVGQVSGKLGRGRHTTRHVELFDLPMGGLLADTPGFNQPDIAMTPTQLAACFPEIQHRLTRYACQFSNCLHRDEPNCVVRGDWERYEHYLNFLDDAIAYQDQLKHRGEEESTHKVKMGDDGEQRLEPKLESKRYRKPSRRSQRQNLQHLCGDLDDLMEDSEN
ncbi:MAG: small ribosomal subunit biogenesis GTPase RsgA [Cyanobacteria bacterium P01_A01_bin.37]